MLLINGALAAWNGLLVATGKIWCECVRGGVCCGGECHCDEGDCCNDVWHADEDPNEPCAEGQIFLRWGPDLECCGCVSETIFDGRVQENVNTADIAGDLCCPTCSPVGFIPYSNVDGRFLGCLGRCCDGESCENTLQGDCADSWFPSSCCEGNGCPRSCCTEDADGVSQCDTVDELRCTGVVDSEPCETACKGACCIDGELVEGSPKTQAECDAVDGCWWGAGSTECGTEGFCRPPFDDDCCEAVTSSAVKLTFQGPRKRRCPELDGCGYQVTVTVTTGQPIYVHGGLFGNPYEACTDIVTFLVCNDEFHVTPAPCSGNLQNVTIEVCWEDAVESESEILRFHCCQDTTYLLGNCDCDCVTTLLYEGGGCTSNAAIQMRGDAIIDASGTGPLVLTANITQGGSCERTLTLTGTNADGNELSGVIQDGSGTSVSKTAPGLWRLSGASTYSGQLRVKDGTLVIAAAVTQSGGSPFGDANTSPDPIIGDDAAGIGGTALLLAENVTVNRSIAIAALGNDAFQVVVIGGTGAGTAVFSQSITFGRSATLQASTGGTARFSGNSLNAGAGFVLTIGSAGNAGIVALNSFAVGFSAVNIVNGTAMLETSDDRIDPDTPVTLGSSLGSATLDINGLSQTLSELTFAGSGSEVTGGTLRLDDSPTVTVAGTGHEILSDVVLDDDATFSLTGTGDLTVSGDVSGSGGIIKEGVGTLTFSGANTYTGTTTINSGTFVLSGTLAATSQVFIGSATLECTGSTKSANAVEITGTATQKGSMTVDTLSGSGSLTHDGGTLTLTNASTLTGTLTVASGSLVLNAIVSGSGVTSATFTPSALTVDFSSAPSSGDQFVLLNGPTGGAYGTVTLTNAGGATGTYNSSTSTLTIN